jgi:hypothetical protein
MKNRAWFHLAGSLLLVASLTGCDKPKSAPVPQSAVSPEPAAQPSAESKPSPTTAQPSNPAPATTRIEMRNVLLHDEAAGTLRVQRLNGRVTPARPGGTISLDDKKSFLIDIDAGIITTSLVDMSRLLNERTFGYPGSPLSDIVLTVKGNQLKLNAKVKKGVLVPIELLGEMGVTPEGNMRVHATSLRALKIPVKGLLGAFGVKMADLIDPKGAKGVSVQGNDLILDVEQLLPPPRKRGKLTDVHSMGDQLVETFGHPGPAEKTPRWRGYLKFEGGVIEFGKLTMRDADLVLTDSANVEWFDFELDHYQKQLEAGYNKVTPKLGLESYMPGYGRLKTGEVAKPK